MSKEKAIELIKDSLLEIPDIDADRGYPALMRVKENLNEILKELEDLWYKNRHGRTKSEF